MIKNGLTVSVIGLMVIGAISVYGYFNLPAGEVFARHWDLQGQADGYSSKLEILLMIPFLAITLSILFTVLPKVLPRRDNLEKSQSFYLAAWAGAIVLLTGVHAMIVWSALTSVGPNLAFIFLALGIFITILGNYMTKSKSNWIAGLRTPWTLTSEYAWAVGNRFCGYIFVLTGIVLVVAAFWVTPIIMVAVLLGGLTLATIGGTIISFFAWRRDPERAL